MAGADEDDDRSETADGRGEMPDTGTVLSPDSAARGLRIEGPAKVGGVGDQVNNYYIAGERPTPPRSGPMGDPLDRLDAEHGLKLEVHEALDTGGAGEGLPRLPPYIERPRFDRDLRKEVARARESSRMVMVVGGSSTGKTRACWEAVRAVLNGEWRVWHPLTPERPGAVVQALEGGRVAPRTVVWLNEAQEYLRPSADSYRGVAEALQDLLADPGRGPVLVLGSLWDSEWRRLEDDGSPSVRELLRKCSRFHAPEEFATAELVRATRFTAFDPRLDWAIHHAQDRRITQQLAGGPELVRRYETGTPAMKAVLEAAMDVLRLKPGFRVPEGFLRNAAPGYLSSENRAALEGDGFDDAVRVLQERRHGVAGPLEKRPSLHNLTYGPDYLLADYLKQYGEDNRWARCPPEEFWVAAASTDNSMSPGSSGEFADAARVRLRFRHADALYRSCGDPESLEEAARLRQRAGDRREAERLTAEASAVGHTRALWEFAREELRSGHHAVARNAYLRAADIDGAVTLADEVATASSVDERDWLTAVLFESRTHDDTRAFEHLAHRLKCAEDWKAIHRFYEQGTAAGVVSLRERLAKLDEERYAWEARGREVHAAALEGDVAILEEVLAERFDAIYPAAFLRVIRSAATGGHWHLISSWLSKCGYQSTTSSSLTGLWDLAKKAGDTDFLYDAAFWRQEWPRFDRLTRPAAESEPERFSLVWVARQLALEGRVDAAERLCAHAPADNPGANRLFIQLMLRRGDWARAEKCAFAQGDRDGRRAVAMLVDRRRRHGEWAEAEQVLRRVCAGSNAVWARLGLADLLRRQKRTLEEAEILTATGASHPSVSARLGYLLLFDHRTEELGKCVSVHADGAELLAKTAWFAELAGDCERAAVYYRHLLNRDVGHGEGLVEALCPGATEGTEAVPEEDTAKLLAHFAWLASLAGDEAATSRVRALLARHDYQELAARLEHDDIGSAASNMDEPYMSEEEALSLAALLPWAGRRFEVCGRRSEANGLYAHALRMGGAQVAAELARARLKSHNTRAVLVLANSLIRQCGANHADSPSTVEAAEAALRELLIALLRCGYISLAMDVNERLDARVGRHRAALVCQHLPVRRLLDSGDVELAHRAKEMFGARITRSEALDFELEGEEGAAAFRPEPSTVWLLEELENSTEACPEAEGRGITAARFDSRSPGMSRPKGVRMLREAALNAEKAGQDAEAERFALLATDAGEGEVLERFYRRRPSTVVMHGEKATDERAPTVLTYGLRADGGVAQAWCEPTPPPGDLRPRVRYSPFGIRGELKVGGHLAPTPMRPSGLVLLNMLLGMLSIGLLVTTPDAVDRLPEYSPALEFGGLLLGAALLPHFTADARRWWRMPWHRAAVFVGYAWMWSPAIVLAMTEPRNARGSRRRWLVAAATLPFSFGGVCAYVAALAYTGPIWSVVLAAAVVAAVVAVTRRIALRRGRKSPAEMVEEMRNTDG